MKLSFSRGLTATLVGLGIAAGAPAFAADPTFSVGGRIHLDTAFYDDDGTPLNNGVLFRRARLGANGTFGDGWGFKVEWDFAENSVAANDLILTYDNLGPGQLKIGQFKVPFGLNEQTSSNAIMFIERSLATEAFADARRIGVGYELFTGNVGYQAMAYSRRAGSSTAGDDPLGLAGRFVFNPMRGDDGTVHLGVAVAYESTDDANQVRYRARPESRAGGTPRLVDTGNIGASENTLKVGLEAAWVSGPFSVEGEYMMVDVSRAGAAPGVDFDGWHVQASYLTQGSRSYRGGRFRGAPVGATEFAVRFSTIDLNDGPVSGGSQDNITLGVNHYASRNVRFMGNVIWADVKDTGEKPWVVALRAQVSF